MNSLRGRMLRVLAITIAACWLGTFACLYSYFTYGQSRVWDDKLEVLATRLIQAIPANYHVKPEQERKTLQPVTTTEDRGELVFQVWSGRDALLARTPGAPQTPLRADFAPGFLSTTVEGRQWRVYGASDSTGRIFVQVGNPQSLVDGALRNKAFGALGAATLLLGIVSLAMWAAVGRALRPVAAMEAAVRARAPFDLTPLPTQALPRELVPLVNAFNHALVGLDQAVEAERRFIGDAAHELRTPLAALQAHGQIALRAGTLEQKDAALAKLLVVAERSTRLSEQLLDMARLESGAKAPQRAPADLSDLVRHVVQEFEVQAEQHGRTILLNLRPCRIACDVDEIGILLRNLVDNALRYTHPGGNVWILCGRVAGDRALVDVADDGPGVREEERAAIFNRFHRVPGTGARGSGIGLSLVAGIARMHAASVAAGPGIRGRGLSVRVEFPAIPLAEWVPAVQATPQVETSMA